MEKKEEEEKVKDEDETQKEEVVEIDPLQLDMAPEEDEDWGE